MKTKKWIFGLVFILIALLLVGCKPQVVDEEKYVTDLSIAQLAGLGTEASPYLINMEKDAQVSHDIIVTADEGADLSLEFKVASGEDIISITGSADKTLKVTGLKGGTGNIVVTAQDRKTVKIYLQVVVSETVVEDVLVRSIYVPADSGEGTLASPYLFEIPNSTERSVVYNVTPANATNKEIEWTLGQITDGVFVPRGNDDVDAISFEPAVTNFVIKGLVSGGTQYVRAQAKDSSGVVIYLQVNVTDYTQVEGITFDNLLAHDTEDYTIVTAMGTTWDMSGEELARKAGLIEGTAGPGAGQAADDMTYWPSLYNLGITVTPAEASDKTLLFEYSTPNVIKFNQDGTYETLGAGETVVTVKSYANDQVSVTVKVVVHESLYPGILKEAFNNLPVSSHNEWNFDNNPDNLATRPLLVEWQLVQMQTNSKRGDTGVDANQKMFYLGQPDRVYGIALESRVNQGQGNINLPTALTWNKVLVGAEATTMEITIGNNDKIHNEYRILMVKADGQVFILKDWTKLLVPNGSSRVADIEIPTDVKGSEVALVIEQRLSELENNAELHIKGIWINQYVAVSDVNLLEAAKTISQDSTYQINAHVLPVNATNKHLLYSVTPSDKGITVSESGLVTASLTAEVGAYQINVMSAEDPTILQVLTITVESNVQTTSFGFKGLTNNSSLTATFDSSGGNVSKTDIPIELVPMFNEGASNLNYTSEVQGSSIVVENNAIKYVGLGESTVVFTASGNPELTFTLQFNVVEFDEANKVITGINKTEVVNTVASNHTIWNNGALARDWNLKTVNKSHGGSKIAEYGEAGDGKMIFEGHSTTANFMQAINIAWNKILVPADINTFVFNVRSHDDDRILESTNFRVLAISVGESPITEELIGWTTVASRHKQNPTPFTIKLDISKYQGQEVVLVIEQTGSLQNNGNWVKNSDSGAGAYLHLNGLSLSTELAPTVESHYSNRLYALTDENHLLSAGWKANVYAFNKNYSWNYGGAFVEGVYQPLTIQFKDKLTEPKDLQLSTVSMFINNSFAGNPSFYAWGLFPALNNSHLANDVRFELEPTAIVSLTDNKLTPLAEGSATLNVYFKAFGSEVEEVKFVVNVLVEEIIDGGGEPPVEEPKTVWANKAEILEDWQLTPGSEIDAGVGEGVDLKVTGTVPGWSSITLTRTITADTSLFEFGSRVFHRDGETYPHFFVKVNDVIVRALGAVEDYVYVDTDLVQVHRYDLRAYVGQEVAIQIGIDRGTHAVITNIGMLPFPSLVFDGKVQIAEGWTLTEGSNMDAGVGEGFDLVVGSGEGWSSITRSMEITSYWHIFEFGARVFVRSGETYPKFVLKINGTIIRAQSAVEDWVYIESDSPIFNQYDLSAYIGQTVTVELGITTGTHAVVTKIELK